MEQYDQEQHANYVETLYVYIKMAGNITAVSDAMHTHRNTIVHRINRIQELFSCRLHGGEELVKLYLGILILQMGDRNK